MNLLDKGDKRPLQRSECKPANNVERIGTEQDKNKREAKEEGRRGRQREGGGEGKGPDRATQQAEGIPST